MRSSAVWCGAVRYFSMYVCMYYFTCIVCMYRQTDIRRRSKDDLCFSRDATGRVSVSLLVRCVYTVQIPLHTVLYIHITVLHCTILYIQYCTNYVIY